MSMRERSYYDYHVRVQGVDKLKFEEALRSFGGDEHGEDRFEILSRTRAPQRRSQIRTPFDTAIIPLPDIPWPVELVQLQGMVDEIRDRVDADNPETLRGMRQLREGLLRYLRHQIPTDEVFAAKLVDLFQHSAEVYQQFESRPLLDGRDVYVRADKSTMTPREMRALTHFYGLTGEKKDFVEIAALECVRNGRPVLEASRRSLSVRMFANPQ